MIPIMHKPGECTDPYYGEQVGCTGVGEWGPNPYAEELYGDMTPVWMCAGARYGSAMDI